jgi:hypothetical protein
MLAHYRRRALRWEAAFMKSDTCAGIPGISRDPDAIGLSFVQRGPDTEGVETALAVVLSVGLMAGGLIVVEALLNRHSR